MKTPILETERLMLRPFCMEDVDKVFKGWESDPEVSKYMFWSSHNDINKTTNWVKEEISKIEAADWYRWAIVLKETQNLLGTALIYMEEEYNKFEIGYNLRQKAWGFGYTTEAMRKVIEFAREKLEIEEVIGRHAKENPSSGRVMEKLGFLYVKDIPYECNEGKMVYEGKEYLLKL